MKPFRASTKRRLIEELEVRGLSFNVLKPFGTDTRIFRAMDEDERPVMFLGAFEKFEKPDWKGIIEKLPGVGVIQTLEGREKEVA